MMVARGLGESAMDSLSAFRARDRAGAIPGILMNRQSELEGGAASRQGCRHLAGPDRADAGRRRLGRLPDGLVLRRVPLASRDPESDRSTLEPILVGGPF